MASIYTYPEISGLSDEDLFIVTDVSNGNSTKSVDLQTLSDYIGSGGGGGGTGTVKSVTGTGSVSGITLSGTVTASGQLTLGGSLVLTSGQITTGLGFTPYNATNPDGFTSFAEPAIFSGGGTPTLASGVTAEQIRTLIGSGSGGEGTNLSGQLTSTTVRINSSTGNDVTIAGATGSIAGVMTAEDKTKLDGISIFKSFAVDGQTTVVADSVSDTLTLVAGDNITITTDSDLDTITINALATLNSNFAGDITVNGITVGAGDGGNNVNTNTVLGRFARSNSGGTSLWNVAVGYEALKNDSQATFNTAVGTKSMSTNTVTGSLNVGLGYNSLTKITSGENNVAIGVYAQENITSGLKNVSVGNYSMSETGINAVENVAVGYHSLYYLSQGENNTALGAFSGYAGSNYTSDECVFIGSRSKPGGFGYTNQIVIGSQAEGKGANTAQIGNDDITALHVGGNGAGLVLKSPNGTAYKITVSDAGAITATAV